MLHRFFLWTVSFFGILSVMGIYLGYLHQIYAGTSAIAIILSAVVSYLVTRRVRDEDVEHPRL